MVSSDGIRIPVHRIYCTHAADWPQRLWMHHSVFSAERIAHLEELITLSMT